MLSDDDEEEDYGDEGDDYENDVREPDHDGDEEPEVDYGDEEYGEEDDDYGDDDDGDVTMTTYDFLCFPKTISIVQP